MFIKTLTQGFGGRNGLDSRLSSKIAILSHASYCLMVVLAWTEQPQVTADRIGMENPFGLVNALAIFLPIAVKRLMRRPARARPEWTE
jgi:hypothetical protein